MSSTPTTQPPLRGIWAAGELGVSIKGNRMQWLGANANAITAIATCLGLLSLLLIFKQLRDARIWNKLHFTYTFFPNSQELEDLEVFLDGRIKFWQRDSALSELEVKALVGKESLTEDDIKKLSESFDSSVKKEDCVKELVESGRKLKIYLNQIEYYCAAISSGIVDSNSAKNIYCYKFRRGYEKSLPWIQAVRRIKNEPSIYIETTKVLNKWFPPPKGESNKY
jgi:hypothetical protein